MGRRQHAHKPAVAQHGVEPEVCHEIGNHGDALARARRHQIIHGEFRNGMLACTIEILAFGQILQEALGRIFGVYEFDLIHTQRQGRPGWQSILYPNV